MKLDEFEKKMAEYTKECDRRMEFVGMCLIAVSAIVTISVIYLIFG